MPEFPDSFEPYASPVEVKVPTAVGPLPGGLKAVCIIAIVLACLGGMGSLASGVGLVAGQTLQAAMNPGQPGPGDGMQQAQQKMQAEVNEISRRYLIPSAAAVILHLLTALLLLAGAIMTLQRKGSGPGMLTFGCASSILYVVGNGILYAVMQLQMIPIMQSFMGDVMAEAGKKAGGGGAQPPDMGNFMMIFIFIGVGIAVLWALVCIIFYLIAIFYVRKPNVRALFQPETADAFI